MADMKPPPWVQKIAGTMPPPAWANAGEQQSNLQGGPVKRFVSNAAEQLNPVPIMKLPDQIMRHPVETAGGIGQTQGELLNKAIESAKAGDLLGAARHAMNYAIPLLGPILEKAGTQMETGDIAGGLGTTAGLAAQIAAPKAIGAVKNIPIKPALNIKPANPIVARAMAQEQAAGVPIPAGTATGNAAIRGIQKLSETTGGAGVAAKAKQVLSEAQTSRMGGLINKAAPGQMAVPETAGQAVVDQINNIIEKLHSSAGENYGEFRQIVNDPANLKDVVTGNRTIVSKTLDASGNPISRTSPVTEKIALPVDMRNVKEALQPVYDDMLKWTMQPARREASPAFQAVQSIVNGPDHISVMDAEKGLSGLKSMSRGAESENLRTFNQGQAARIVPQLQDAIDATAAGAGSNALKALQRGRILTRQKWEAAEVLGKLRDEPVQLFNQATYAQDAGIDRLRSVVDVLKKAAGKSKNPNWMPPEMKLVGRAYLQKLMDQATAEGGFAKGGTIASAWERMGPQTKKILFNDPGYIKELDNFFIVTRKIAEEINPSGTAPLAHIAMTYSGPVALALRNLFTGHPLAAGADILAGTVYHLTTRGITQLLYSPKGIRLLNEAIKMPVTANNAAARAVMAGNILKLAQENIKPSELPKAAQNQQKNQPVNMATSPLMSPLWRQK